MAIIFFHGIYGLLWIFLTLPWQRPLHTQNSSRALKYTELAVSRLWITVPCCLMKKALNKLWHIYTHHGATLLQNTGGFCQLSRHCVSNNARISWGLWGLWMRKQAKECVCVCVCLPFVYVCACIWLCVCTFIYLYLARARAQMHLSLFVCKWGL